MLVVPDSMTDGWLAEVNVGDTAYYTRITIQRMRNRLINYDLEGMNSTKLQGSGQFSTMIFGQNSRPVEIKNFKNVGIDRAGGQFCASANVAMVNNRALPVGVLGDSGEFEQPGVYTPTRGVSPESFTRWDQVTGEFANKIVPDRIIRIYQGYGVNWAAAPEEDEHLVCVFTGLVDKVTISTDKMMTLGCRDMGRVLLDSIAFPDVVPFTQYPLYFEKYHLTAGTPVTSTSTSGSWIRPKYQDDSNKVYVGRGFNDGGSPYVQSNGGVRGHLGKHAFDSSRDSYWLSVGNHLSWSSDYEWVQGSFKAGSVSAVKVSAYAGPYKVFISLMDNDGDWVGSKKVPYKARSVDAGTRIAFVKQAKLNKGKETTIHLPKSYANIKAVRVTFQATWDSGIGEFQHRAGCKDVQVFKSTSSSVTTVPEVRVGNVEDYSDCIKWLLAWGGFFWPKNSSALNYVTHSDGTRVTYTGVPESDPALPHGRIWGDLQQTGTYPLVKLTEDHFDKQPLSDCLQHIAGIVGFSLWFDETGGAIWRLPNIFKLGNYVAGAMGGPSTGRTDDMITIDERTTLLGLTQTLDSRNVREKTLVASVTGKYGTTADGFNPYPSGLRRFAIYSDNNFANAEEARVMAELIALRQFMTYRESTITIPTNPAIQIDDQVNISERITSDTYVHYVKGISSNHDLSTGRATMTLTTQWLGDTPNTIWAIDTARLDPATVAYLNKVLR